jgi:hypothetical protein
MVPVGTQHKGILTPMNVVLNLPSKWIWVVYKCTPYAYFYIDTLKSFYKCI